MGRRLVRGTVPRRHGGGALGVARSGLLLVGLTAARLAGAQAVLGGFDDATVPGRGELRIRLGGIFSTWDDRYGGFSTAPGDRRFPAGARYAFDTLGVTQLPLLTPLQDGLVGLTDGTPEAVSLGRTVSRARGGILDFPITGELGITRRISIGVTVPTVRTRHVVDVQVNPGGTTGNTGFNPALEGSFPDANTATNARTRNLAVRTQFEAAASALQRLLDTCPTTPGENVPAGCAPVIANRPAAVALVTNANAFSQGVVRVYGLGTTASPGLAFVPVAGSTLQQQVERRLGALRTQFQGFGIDNIAAGTAPAGSPARIAMAGLQRILVATGAGIEVDSLQSITRSSTGDVDFFGNFLLVDTFGSGTERLAPTGFHVRATATAGFRFGFSAREDVPNILTDIPTASGENAILVRGAADLAFGRRGWATIAARFTSPMADEQVVRITDVPEQPFPELFRQQRVGRQLGREIQLEVTPRWSFGEWLGVAAQYAYRSKAADKYTGTFAIDSGGATLDAATLGLGTEAREQRFGIGLTFSTLGAYMRRRSGLPMEVSLLHLETIAGSNLPKLSTDVVQLRFYIGRDRPSAAPGLQSGTSLPRR